MEISKRGFPAPSQFSDNVKTLCILEYLNWRVQKKSTTSSCRGNNKGTRSAYREPYWKPPRWHGPRLRVTCQTWHTTTPYWFTFFISTLAMFNCMTCRNDLWLTLAFLCLTNRILFGTYREPYRSRTSRLYHRPRLRITSRIWAYGHTRRSLLTLTR